MYMISLLDSTCDNHYKPPANYFELLADNEICNTGGGLSAEVITDGAITHSTIL